nr:glycoside hydrolase family 9 protein [Litorilituus lipolyticus]
MFDTDRYVDVSGGWNDAGGDTGKYLSHLSYANYMNPQQLAHVAWALAYAYQRAPQQFKNLILENQVIEEVFWGADYLHRILDEQGYFYMTVFDQWNTNNAERVVTAYVGADGIYSEDYQSAFRQGAGSAIAALARAAMLAKTTGKQGEYSATVYLADAEKAFKHLQDNNGKNNKAYADDGEENIIDDYTALLAATELYKATKSNYYLSAARSRAENLAQRLTPEGWFISNNINSKNLRPFYHAAEAGFPILSLSQYIAIENEADRIKQSQEVMKKHLDYQLTLNNQVNNPFNYARQTFKTYEQGKLSTKQQTGFFIPHANETEYWWQGESARLSSLAMAAILTGRMSPISTNTDFSIDSALSEFAQNQMDWTLGRNPYDLSMLNGFGVNNPVPYDGLSMVYGGISNGITGAKTSSSGQGIEFGPEKDWQNWRWVEQWLPHSTWFLLAITEMAVE